MSTCMRGSRGTGTSTRLPVQRGRGALRVLSTALSTDPTMPTTALTAARPTGLLASEIEIEIESEILAYEQGLVLTPSLQQPESDEIGPRSSDETAYGSDEIGPRSSDETAYGRRHLPRTAPYSTPHHPLRSQWRTCPPRRILCSRSGCLNASY